jgi:hypothetical protein
MMDLNQSGSRETAAAWIDDDAAAALRERPARFVRSAPVMLPAFLGVEDEDVGLASCSAVGKVLPPEAGAAPVEERDPLGEEARVVVRAGAVGLRAGADVDAERGSAAEAKVERRTKVTKAGSEGEEEGEFHGEIF